MPETLTREQKAKELLALYIDLETLSETGRVALIAAVQAVLGEEPTTLVISEAPEPGEIALPEGAPALLALCGRPRAGKDWMIDYLERTYTGVGRLAFSDAITAEANDLLAGTGHTIGESNKPLPHYRSLLQAIGMARREQDGEYWTDRVGERIDALQQQGVKMICVSGVRMPNDLHPVKSRGGIVWRIVRPGNPYPADHVLETTSDTLAVDRELINATEGDTHSFAAEIERALRES